MDLPLNTCNPSSALKEQAKVFYSETMASVDPEISIGFEFAG